MSMHFKSCAVHFFSIVALTVVAIRSFYSEPKACLISCPFITCFIILIVTVVVIVIINIVVIVVADHRLICNFHFLEPRPYRSFFISWLAVKLGLIFPMGVCVSEVRHLLRMPLLSISFLSPSHAVVLCYVTAMLLRCARLTKYLKCEKRNTNTRTHKIWIKYAKKVSKKVQKGEEEKAIAYSVWRKVEGGGLNLWPISFLY